MTQALAGFNEHGLFLATDSLATRFDAAGHTEVFNVSKLFPLGPRCAILSGGAGVSVSLSQGLRRMLQRHPSPLSPEEIARFALHFLSQGYGRHLEKHGPEPEGFRRLYFIVAGYDPEKPPPGFQLILLGSEENELPLRLIPVANLVVMPRNLGMEMRLFKALAEGLTLDQLLEMSKEFLEKQTQLKEEVGPPYYYATITPEGYRTFNI
ncbi:MAG: hypothetical protein HY790_13355 [Deltaproteobacteria bacterium]|nr:hypothetical protein [Deltaproteobacteria bacterium]